MAFVRNGYVVRKSPGGKGVLRDWWLIKSAGIKKCSVINLRPISFPNTFEGKKVRLKIEIIKEN